MSGGICSENYPLGVGCFAGGGAQSVCHFAIRCLRRYRERLSHGSAQVLAPNNRLERSQAASSVSQGEGL